MAPEVLRTDSLTPEEMAQQYAVLIEQVEGSTSISELKAVLISILHILKREAEESTYRL